MTLLRLGPYWASWGSFGALWSVLDPSWEAHWAVLGRLGCIVRLLGDILGPYRALVGPSWPSWMPSWAAWRHIGAVFVAAWAVLGQCWRSLGRSWGDLDGLLGRLGPSESRKGANPKIIQKPQYRKLKKEINNEFCFLGPYWAAAWAENHCCLPLRGLRK